MDDCKLNECLTSLFDAFVEKEQQESQSLIAEIPVKLNQLKIDFSNPEKFNLYLTYKVKSGLRQIAHAFYKDNISDNKNIRKIDFIYLQYDFMEHNISELCTLKEGGSCCIDKSRAIIEMYLKYALTSEIPEFNPEIEHYWIPKFGTYKDWIDFCEGLYAMYYGKTKQYFEAYDTLLQAEIRKYKHTLHLWYIKFKDGEVVQFSNSWDNNIKNPLDNKESNKGDYYLVYKKYVSHRNYDQDNTGDLLSRHYCKVPKEDISEIYKISEEKMV